MKRILLFAFLLLSLNAFAAPFQYPHIKAAGDSLMEFIPEGWEIFDSASGDLDKNGTTDIAFVIQYKEAVEANISCSEEREPDSSIPRILVILLQNPVRGTYRLSLQNNTFILRQDENKLMQPFEGLKIEKGTLYIDFTGSGGTRWACTYNFKFRRNNWYLVGADELIYTINGDYESISYNFLSHRAKITKGVNMFGEQVNQDSEDSTNSDKNPDPEETTEWVKLKPDLKINLATLRHTGCLGIIEDSWL
jgi:hypothetical protein